MKKTAVVAGVLLSVLGGVASADDCPHVYKPPAVKHRKPPAPKPKAPEAPKAIPPCGCVGQEGPPGPRGHDGRTVVVERTEVVYSGLDLRLGVMGSVYAPHGDWSWGPALQLRSQLDRRDELVIDVGFAGILNGIDWSPGRQSGVLVHAGFARYLTKHLGLTTGLHYTEIGGTPSNGPTSGSYLDLDVGGVARYRVGKVDLRFELAPAIGGLRDTHSPSDTQFAIGLTGSAFVGWAW